MSYADTKDNRMGVVVDDYLFLGGVHTKMAQSQIRRWSHFSRKPAEKEGFGSRNRISKSQIVSKYLKHPLIEIPHCSVWFWMSLANGGGAGGKWHRDRNFLTSPRFLFAIPPPLNKPSKLIRLCFTSSLRAKGTLTSEPRFSTPCDMTFFPVSRGKNRISHGVENRASLISVPLALRALNPIAATTPHQVLILIRVPLPLLGGNRRNKTGGGRYCWHGHTRPVGP